MKKFFLLSVMLVATLAYSQSNKHLTVTDCQGNVYPVVKIGNHYWMAENLRSTRYDTESECKEFLDESSSIIGLSTSLYAPYCVSANKLHKGEENDKYGMLYNWSAAMGYSKNEAKKQKGDYRGRRQGICPNGFHLPSFNEWIALIQACGGLQEAGSMLKSSSGWNGTDDYGFSVLPAGSVFNFSIVNTEQQYGMFHTCDAHSKSETYKITFSSDSSVALGVYIREIDNWRLDMKMVAKSVRCVKN